MKQKIKIMEQRPQLSDEEIRSYMDFDRLLADKKLLAKPRYGYLKWVAPLIALSGIVAWLIFNYTPEKVQQSQSIVADDAQKDASKPAEGASSHELSALSPQKVEPKAVEKSVAVLKEASDAKLMEMPRG